MTDLPNIEEVFDKIPWKNLHKIRETSKSFNKRIANYKNYPAQKEREKEEKLQQKQQKQQKKEKQKSEDQMFNFVLEDTFGHLNWQDLRAFGNNFPEFNPAIDYYNQNVYGR